MQHDLTQPCKELGALQQRLQDREAGWIKGGNAPTLASMEKQCQHYLSDLIDYTLSVGPLGVPRLHYQLNSQALQQLEETQLG